MGVMQMLQPSRTTRAVSFIKLLPDLEKLTKGPTTSKVDDIHDPGTSRVVTKMWRAQSEKEIMVRNHNDKAIDMKQGGN